MKIREAKTSDAKMISKFIQKCVDKINYKKYTSNQILAWKRDYSEEKINEKIKKRIFFCAYDEGKLIGTICLDKEYIYGMYIKSNLKRKGFGKELLKFVEDYANKLGMKKLKLNATPVAKRFYLKQGYKVIGKIKIEMGGCNFIETLMEKKLK